MRKRLLWVGLSTCLVACASTPTAPPAPVLTLSVEDVGPAGSGCDGAMQQLRGRRPDGTAIIAVVTATSDQPVPLKALEQVVFVAARRRCADGFAIVRAEASDGATGFTKALAEVWVTAPAATPAATP